MGSSDIDADVDWNLKDGLIVHHALDGDISGVHAGKVVDATLEDGLPHFVDGRIGTAASFDGQRYIDAGMPPNLGYEDEFTLSAWIYPNRDNGVIFSRANEETKVRLDGAFILKMENSIKSLYKGPRRWCRR